MAETFEELFSVCQKKKEGKKLMTEYAFYSHSKCHFKKFYSGGKYCCPLNFMKNNSKTFRPNNIFDNEKLFCRF